MYEYIYYTFIFTYIHACVCISKYLDIDVCDCVRCIHSNIVNVKNIVNINVHF